VGELDAGWGLEAVEGEKKGEERIYPRSHLGSPSFFVSKCKRTSARGWVLKRGQREMERWSARGAILAGLQRGRREKKKRGRREVFGRISFEFQKIQKLVQVVVMTC
jgi:hypothetical protein